MPRVVHHDIDVAAPPEACWRVLSDLGRFPEWFPRLARAQALLPGPGQTPFQPGGRFELHFDFGRVKVPVRCDVTEAVAGERLRWIGRGWGITGDHAYSLKVRHPGLTRVTSHEELSGAGTLLLTGRIFDRVDEEVHASMDRLKALIERQ